jgi:hypothetical protein
MINTKKGTYLFGLGVSFLAVAYFSAIALKTGNMLVSATLFAVTGSGVTSFSLWHLGYRQKWLGIITSIPLGLCAGVSILVFGLLGLFFEIYFLTPDPSVFFYGTIFHALIKGLAFKKLFLALNGLHLLSATTIFSVFLATYAKKNSREADKKIGSRK